MKLALRLVAFVSVLTICGNFHGGLALGEGL